MGEGGTLIILLFQYHTGFLPHEGKRPGVALSNYYNVVNFN